MKKETIEILMACATALMAAATCFLAFWTWSLALSTDEMVKETRKLVNLAVREEGPDISIEEFIPNFEDFCKSELRIVNLGKKTTNDLKWTMEANVINTSDRKHRWIKVTDGTIPQLKPFVDEKDRVKISRFDLSLLDETLLKTNTIYAFRFVVEDGGKKESLQFFDPKLLEIKTYCQ